MAFYRTAESVAGPKRDPCGSACDLTCTFFQAVELLLNGLLCGLKHQVPHIQDLYSCHSVLVHLYFRLRPVYSDGVTPELNTT